eukprot:TRINITY_DN67341_c0_g2_i1.p1 TRINITY_DN67341_c0_g2~~TRINITY_DN67341_c0_g2_i1.p1  ORF type:complete len:107 (+),score=3.35 TRINITY_DN67341_c0_g2_i1:26-322(+)
MLSVKLSACAVADSSSLRSKLLEEIRMNAKSETLPKEEKTDSTSKEINLEKTSVAPMHPWKEALDKLAVMGFGDRLRNIKLLITHAGDLPAVIPSLLQ